MINKMMKKFYLFLIPLIFFSLFPNTAKALVRVINLLMKCMNFLKNNLKLTHILTLVLMLFYFLPNFAFATTLNLQVSSSLGDTQMGGTLGNSGRNVTVNGTIQTTATNLPGSQGGNDEFSVGLRFTNITIPQGTTISNATLVLTPFETYSASPSVVRFHVSTQASDNAGALTSTNGDLNITSRPRSTADAGPWTQTSLTIDVEESLDVTNIIQEIINRAGWVSGNSMVILIDTHADTDPNEWQSYNSYDDNPSKAPKLNITYDGGNSVVKVKIRRGVTFRSGVKFR